MSVAVIEFKSVFRPGERTPVDMVLLAPKGDGYEKTRTWRRVSKLRPDPNASDTRKNSLSYQHQEYVWGIVRPAYEAWKEGNQIPETGTPLAAWPGISSDQAEHLRAMGCKTVEDVAGLGEAASKLPWPGARRLPETAADFLKAVSTKEKDDEIAALKAQIEALGTKRGPGRPKKEAEPA